MLPRAETSRVRAIARELKSYSDDGRSAIERILAPLQELVAGHTACGYRVTSTGEQLSLDYAHVVGRTATHPVSEVLTRYYAKERGRFGLYDPMKPEPKQRNRVVRLGRSSEWLQSNAEHADRLRKLGIAEQEQAKVLDALGRYAEGALGPLGVKEDHQMRVLICDGPSVLAWVGAFSEEPFSDQAATALGRLVPALKQRLKLEAELRLSRFQLECLAAALDAVAGVAVICSAEGHVLHANNAARARLDGSPEFSARLLAVVEAHRAGQPHPDAEVSQLKSAGMREALLIVFRPPPKDVDARMRAAAKRWGFTSRQLEVLTLLIQGEMNRTIASALNCSERTIEIHVTNIFDRMGVDCRSAAVARFYEET